MPKRKRHVQHTVHVQLKCHPVHGHSTLTRVQEGGKAGSSFSHLQKRKAQGGKGACLWSHRTSKGSNRT